VHTHCECAKNGYGGFGVVGWIWSGAGLRSQLKAPRTNTFPVLEGVGRVNGTGDRLAARSG
jgi:hypothetical protein